MSESTSPLAAEKSLAREHTPEAIAERLQAATTHMYLGDFVLGAIDGTVTTFAIVAGVAGAELSSAVALVLGLANVLADGFSMAASNYLKSRADHQMLARFREMEEMHIERIPEGEKEEVRQIYASKGFQGRVLDTIVAVITGDRRRWVDTMLTEEWGLQLEPPSPLRAAISTFVAFILAGLIPLMPLFLGALLTAQEKFLASAAITALTFVAIGVARGSITRRNLWLSAGETLLVGGGAAALAYIAGVLLRGLVDVPA